MDVEIARSTSISFPNMFNFIDTRGKMVFPEFLEHKSLAFAKLSKICQANLKEIRGE
jgi:hypothetical protein